MARPARMLPQDMDAERACLGAMLVDAKAVEAVMKLELTEEIFMSSQHRTIYTAIREMFATFTPIDMVTMKRHLQASGSLADAGGTATMCELAECSVNSDNAVWYAKILGDFHTLRQIIARSEKLLNDAYMARSPAPLVIELAALEKTAVALGGRIHDGKYISPTIGQLHPGAGGLRTSPAATAHG